MRTWVYAWYVTDETTGDTFEFQTEEEARQWVDMEIEEDFEHCGDSFRVWEGANPSNPF